MQARICSNCLKQYRDAHNSLSIVLTGFCIACLRDKDSDPLGSWENEGGK